MTRIPLLSLAATAALVLSFSTTGCRSGSSGSAPAPTGATLQTVEYGRLVDVYAYRRIDPARPDRRDTTHRVPVLIAREVLIHPEVLSQELFDAAGNARPDADYRYLPFDVTVGHDQLLILWDDTVPPEAAAYQRAYDRVTRSLPKVTAAFRAQDTSKRPIPVVPRNATLRLVFDRDLGVKTEFFAENPSVVQLLEFINPTDGGDAFRPVPARILGRGNTVLIDTSLVGGEAGNGIRTHGLPPSRDRRTANLRLALPTSGVSARILELERDGVAELNGTDANGDAAVIRDFRSGNVQDGAVARLPDVEAPMIVAHLQMGITAIDPARRILTINKRNQAVAIRGRIPYVDGPLDPVTGFAMGPPKHPLVTPLRTGDVVMQEVRTAEGTFTIRAEIVRNLDVGSIPGDPAFKGLGMNRVEADPRDAIDGGDDPFVRVQVDRFTVTDAQGNGIPFRKSDLPLGEDCIVRVHYYHRVPYRPTANPLPMTEVSDAGRAARFLAIDPAPPALTANRELNLAALVNPNAKIGLRFSEPMDMETVEAFDNFVLTNATIPGEDFLRLIEYPKPIALALIASRLRDESGDATLLQLDPPLGHFHDKAAAAPEQYWLHMRTDAEAPTDAGGNRLDLFDRSPAPAQSFSVRYALDPAADSNHVGYRSIRFAGQDEDGTALGSPDAFGQFQLLDGELRALPVSRFTAVADNQTLSGITRFDRGECDIPGPAIAPLGALPGMAVTCPSMFWAAWTVPLSFQAPAVQPGGGVTEPHNQRGSRMQMALLEDDFGFSYHDETKYMIDIEQLHWAPFNDGAVRFDVFDRYTLRLAHSDKRPDLAFVLTGGACLQDCFSGRSGLRTRFDDNLLVGTTYTTVVKDAVYEINPNDASRSNSGTQFVPYPTFERSYTWRDPRLVTWDVRSNRAVGLGGAEDPTANPATRDTTASVSSPYVPNVMETAPAARNFASLHLNTEFVFDYGDFHGFRQRDHDPIALPLLMDFSVYPDGPENGGFANGSNLFHIAIVGPCWTPAGPGGYYNGAPLCVGGAQPIPFPERRAHTTGGIDPVTGAEILVDPDTAASARPSVIKDMFWGDPVRGLWTAPAKDDHVHWTRADFVRRMSLVTYGFWDTLRPNAHDFVNNPLPAEVDWDGDDTPDGVPNLAALGTGIRDIATVMDPPLSEQPVGTRVVTEWRGARRFDRDDRLFDQSADVPNPITPTSSLDLVRGRGNLLNPYYACEAYRYAMTNPAAGNGYQPTYTTVFPPTEPRVAAGGLTPYVTEDRLDDIRVNGLLPRFLNLRFVMENNVGANPPVSPGLKSFGVAYRIGR